MDRKLVISFFQFIVSVSTIVISGFFFENLGASSILASILAIISFLSLLLKGKRDIFQSLWMLIFTTITLRMCGLLSVQDGFEFTEFVILWTILTAWLFSCINLCLPAFGIKIQTALKEIIRTATTTAHQSDLKLWYLHKIVFLPIISLLWPVSLSLAVWMVHMKEVPQSFIKVDILSSIAFGLTFPLFLLAKFANGVRSSAKKIKHSTPHSRINVVTKILILSIIFFVGLFLEHQGPRLYYLWTVCIFLAGVAIWTSSTINSAVSTNPQFTPEEYTQEQRQDTVNTREFAGFYATWLFITVSYYILLSLNYV